MGAEEVSDARWNPEAFEQALAEAQTGLAEGGVPIGAALELDGQLAATGRNERVQHGDPIAHGEIACLRRAGRQPTYRTGVLYTTLAPCVMCSGAILLFGIPRVVVGENRTFPGELDLLRSRGVEVIVLDDARCIELMETFQATYPHVWAEDIGDVAIT